MSRIAAALVVSVILTATACAQSIVGESTYEDNFLHRPPPAPEATPVSRGADAARKERPGKPETPGGRAETDDRR